MISDMTVLLSSACTVGYLATDRWQTIYKLSIIPWPR